MGAAMVPHLVKAGHRVSVWNRNPAPAKVLTDIRGRPAHIFAHPLVHTSLHAGGAYDASLLIPIIP